MFSLCVVGHLSFTMDKIMSAILACYIAHSILPYSSTAQSKS